MAGRTQPVTPFRPAPFVWIAGSGALLLTFCLTVGAVIIVAAHGQEAARLSTADWRAFRFTALQAFLSALLSVAFAIPVARALARRRFRGRDMLARLMGAPFLLPVVVAILGVVAIWGRSGFVSQALLGVGLERLNVYGLGGVLIAHVFFNMPLAVRLLLQGYADIPAERWRLAAQLGVEGRALWRLLEWPMLRAVAPGAFALVFLICATSFAVALSLGGGPRATTLELAIYQAMRFDFDLGRAALLAGLQFALCLVLAICAARASTRAGFGAGVARTERWDGRGRAARLFDAAMIVAAVLFLGGPLGAALWHGAPGMMEMGAGVWPAALRSIVVAAASAAIAVSLALALAAFVTAIGARAPSVGKGAEAFGLITLALSPFVTGVALFIVLRPYVSPVSVALELTTLVNAAMALPFALRMLLPAWRDAVADYGRLAASLGMGPAARLRLIWLPRLRRPIGFAAGLSAALSMGDLGVIALFSAPNEPTLPLYMYGLMSAHRLDAAGGAAILLALLAFGAFWVADAWGGRDART